MVFEIIFSDVFNTTLKIANNVRQCWGQRQIFSLLHLVSHKVQYLFRYILLLLYVNNLPNNVKSIREVNADDTKILKAIKSPNDAVTLQEDINNLVNWSSEYGLQFIETKCKAQSITCKTNPIPTIYSMKGSGLAPILNTNVTLVSGYRQI